MFDDDDLCSKEVPVIEVDVSIGGARVCRILDRLFLTRPLPATLIVDNGPEFARDRGECLGGTARRASALHPTGEAGAKRLYRELQWQVSG